MSIISLLNQIKQDEIVLPNIQRKFVWREEKIYSLMDSIMRGYPIGIILMWESYEDIQYRKFSEADVDEIDFRFSSNEANKRLILVLDGQQRLQSLYVALYGTYGGKKLCLNVLSGQDKDNTAEIRYEFRFLSKNEKETENQNSEKRFSDPKNNRPDDDHEKMYFVSVQDLYNMGYEDKAELIDKLEEELHLDIGEKKVIDRNLSYLKENLQSNENILRQSILDQNKPRDAKDRKSIHDILEVFVRVNTLGTQLTRSDLIFSMMKLNWEEAAINLPQFVAEINQGNRLNITNDFVIKCLFTVSGFGPYYDINILRSKSNVELIEKNFSACCNSIRSCIDFVRQQCWINSSGILPGINSLIPFVYYFYHMPQHVAATEDITNLRKFFYFAAFTKVFSRWSDPRINDYTRNYLHPALKAETRRFPYEKSIEFIKSKEYGFNYINDGLLNNNHHLVLNLLQQNYGRAAMYKENAPEVDHIFPRDGLSKINIPSHEISFYANYWYLPLHTNRNKSAKHPKEFMKDQKISQAYLKKVFIDIDLLDYPLYKQFIQSRASKIREYIETLLELKEPASHLQENK